VGRREAKMTKKYMVVLTQGEDGWIVAECPALPGCISQGRTRAEAIENIKEAIDLWLETRASLDTPQPPLPEIVEVQIAANG
jgi:predicted RNase H-like HicB family nuclease